MDRETLYKFFEGAASYEEEVRIRQWMEHSPENRREFLKERKIFDSMLLLGDEKRGIAIPPKGAFTHLMEVAFEEKEDE